eukprot:TRINITY_DN243_c0_g1_i5.p1 TRINITY_DN243_c0_g1~~TRINITY_DN243_c0_g1_i5.p1  ORF type:complete len:215 (+),score=30.77 TRINITY_DN243_c0_g1_i5:964-1608(+)
MVMEKSNFAVVGTYLFHFLRSFRRSERDKYILLAHHSSSDESVFKKALDQYPEVKNLFNLIDIRFVDTIPLFKNEFPDLESYSLGNVALALDMPDVVSHRALDDANQLYDLLNKMHGDELKVRIQNYLCTSKRKRTSSAPLSRKRRKFSSDESQDLAEFYQNTKNILTPLFKNRKRQERLSLYGTLCQKWGIDSDVSNYLKIDRRLSIIYKETK